MNQHVLNSDVDDSLLLPKGWVPKDRTILQKKKVQGTITEKVLWGIFSSFHFLSRVISAKLGNRVTILVLFCTLV